MNETMLQNCSTCMCVGQLLTYGCFLSRDEGCMSRFYFVLLTLTFSLSMLNLPLGLAIGIGHIIEKEGCDDCQFLNYV